VNDEKWGEKKIQRPKRQVDEKLLQNIHNMNQKQEKNSIENAHYMERATGIN